MIFIFEEIILFSEVIFLVLYATLREYLEEIAPSYLASDWDNSGPQVDLNQEKIERVLIGLDPTIELIDQGIKKETDLLITHHPLIFSEMEKIDSNSLTGSKILSLIQNNLGLLSIHTPFDRSARGLSLGLAKRLQLNSTKPLKSSRAPNLFRLVVFVPESKEEEVIEALSNAGAGRIGNYRDSYYRSRVEGSFTPSKEAKPYVGRPDQTESTEEIKLEFLVSPKYKRKVTSALYRFHPYEEPGFLLEETERPDPNVGLGRLGKWENKKDLGEIKSLVSNSLSLKEEQISVHGSITNPIKWVATSPGAGGTAIDPAINSGMDLLITGELDYHERLEALERGLTVMEIGHFHSEKVFSPWLKKLLRDQFGSEELKIDIHGEVKSL